MWSNHSDVFVLTYRRRRPDAIFCPDVLMKPDDKSAFSRGRNTLLLAARLEELRRGFAYSYYIFSDSDVIAQGTWPAKLPGFEGFLKEWEPAIGMPLYWNEVVPFMYTHLFNREQYVDPKRPRSIYWHDQMFVAIHRDAGKLLLPLESELDKKDHLVSQWKMVGLASLLFRGHVLLYMGMEIRNPKHDRDDDEDVEEQCKNISAALRAQVPERLRHCVQDPWNGYAFSFSSSGFRARLVRAPGVGSDFRLMKGADMSLLPGEQGMAWMHSYYPWAAAAKKRWDYSTATLATSPSCDDEPESRGFWWGAPCHGPKVRSMASWLSCARFNFLGAKGG